MRWKEETGSRRGRNWMSAMGILFIVSAAIIARSIRLFYIIEYSIGFFFDNFVNAEITNEKFVIAMLAIGGSLVYWGFFKKKEDHGPPDEHEWRRSNR